MWTPRRLAVALLAVVIAVAALWQLGRSDSSPPAPNVPAETATGAESGGSVARDLTPAEEPPSTSTRPFDEGGVPVGFERTELGARRAAVAYLEMTEVAVELAPADAGALAEGMASVSYRDQHAQDTETAMVELAETIPAGIRLRLAPIAARSAAAGDGWEVAVWFVEAITIGTEGVVDDWRTATYRLVWEDDTWKIDSFDSVRGPMPGRGTQPASETPSGFEAVLSGFSDEGLS